MSSTHLLHHQHHHSHHQDQSPPPLPPVQRPLTYQEQQQQHHYHRSPLISSHSTASSDRISGPSAQLQSFAEDRKNGVPLPRVGGAAIVGEDSIVSSRNSSPYTSPHIAPRPRAPIAAAVESTMEEVTLPPIQAAVPMRRGAVSGASSGPSLPFPPIRPPFEDDDMPSRGPSPTLGKRGSFSMGHSNHVPPGPEVQLPTPVLSGSGERRGTIISIPSFSSSSLHHHSEGSTLDVPRSSIARLADDSNYYAPPASSTPQRYGATDGVIPWSSQYKPSRSGSVDPSSGPPPLPPYHSSPSSYVPGGAVASSASSHRIGHFNDDTHRQYSYSRPSPLVSQPYTYAPEPRTVSSNYRLEYQRDASEMSPGSNSSAMHVDSSLSPRMKQSHLMHHEDPYGHSHSRSSVSSHHHHPYQHHTQSHLVAPHESETSINGKRPRSAPRVMSSQPRIFACTQCPARFARNHDLKRHQRGHLSVRPYPCNWCGKSFSRKDALKRHILVKGCGKDGKGGSGKGQGKSKRGTDGMNESKAPKEESHAGEADEGNSEDDDEDQDEQASEENQDSGDSKSNLSVTIQQRWTQDENKSDMPKSRGQSSAVPRYSTAPTFRSGPSLAALTSVHVSRPSTSVA